MPADPLLTTAEAAALVGVPSNTVAGWKAQGLLVPAGHLKGRALYRPADVLACFAARLARKNYPKDPAFRAGPRKACDEETEAELEELIRHQRANLPAWWGEPDPEGE